MAPLAPLLQQRGLQLIERPADNVELAAYKGLLLKGSYCRWPERHLAGNAIYFFVKVLGEEGRRCGLRLPAMKRSPRRTASR